jgi:glycosyltransferase involved in cell wall biosynthesis
MIRIAIVSKLFPLTHYSLYLGRAIAEIPKSKVSLLFYRSKSDKVSLDLNEVKDVWSQNVLYPLQIFRQVLRDRPNLVHIQHEFNMFGGASTALVFPFLLFLLRLKKVPTIVTVHAVVPPLMIDGEFATTFGVPSVGWPALRIALLWVYRSIGSLPTALIVHAGANRDSLQFDYAAPPEKITVIPIGVPKPLRIVPVTKWSRMMNGKNTILFFGYLTRRKGVEYLVRAFQELAAGNPSWTLVIAGGKLNYSAPYITEIQDLISQLGINDRIIMVTTTPFPVDELHDLFELSAFVVLPYTMFSMVGGSLVLSFAIQHAKPIVVTDSNVIREIIQVGEEGLVCKSKDVDSLRKAMMTLIADTHLRERLSTAMREKAKALAWENIAESTRQLYVKLSVEAPR